MKRKGRQTEKFMIGIMFFSFVLFWQYFTGITSNINTTMLAFSYKYGFISRGFIGTIYQLLDKILPFDMMSYRFASLFFEVSLLLFYCLLFYFIYKCISRTDKQVESPVRYIIYIYLICAIPMFCSEYNLGRLDMYCLMLSILAIILLMQQTCEWLIVPIVAVGVMIHQGNVFMYLNIIIVMLLYRILSEENQKKRRKYFVILILSSVIAIALLLWFELFSHVNGSNIYEEIVRDAMLLGNNQEYHEDVLQHEILGVDLSDREWEYHKKNFVELPIYLILISPYIAIAVHFFKGLLARAKTKTDKLKYIFVIIGAGAILPDMLLKVDYGRWLFATISYYAIMIMALAAINDTNVNAQLDATVMAVQKRSVLAPLLIVYPLLFQPMMHIAICPLTDKISNIVNTCFQIWIPW